MIEAQHLNRKDGDTVLLNDVSLTIAPGDRVGLVGESGSGKSTLLRAIAVLDPLEAGTICDDGVLVHGDLVPVYRRRIAYVHQRAAMIAGTVQDNLRLPFQMRANEGLFDLDAAIGLLKDLGRGSELIHQVASKISGGEQQSVALVRTILANPTVLLLDEPTASLDPVSIESVERFLLKWIGADKNRAWVWASHDADQVSRMTDHVWRMKAGKLIDE